jgi:hypothetical protein
MKTCVFTPKAVSGWTDDDGTKHEPTFSGTIELKIPDYFERQALKEILLRVVGADGESDIESLKDAKRKINVSVVMKKMADLVKFSVPFYQKVELKNLKTGAVHSSFEDISMDPDAEEMLQEVSQELAKGLSPSKNL